MKKKVNNTYIVLMLMFILFLCLLPESTCGVKRIVSTLVASFIVAYSITHHLQNSVLVSIFFTFVMGLLDNRGCFSDYYENFDIKPVTNESVSTLKTEIVDTTDFKDEDLDKILHLDEKQNNDDNEHLKKAGGGLDQLKNLLDMAKKDSPYTKDTTNYSPAQAQKATFHLIDTVKQLKETMNEMIPLMTVGNNLIKLRENMNGLK